MESVVSPSAPADTANLILEARKGIEALARRSVAYSQRLNPEVRSYTFNACCGSRILNKDGTSQNANAADNVPLSREGIIWYLEKKYGKNASQRFGNTYEATITAWMRVNKPGVWYCYMDKDSAIKLLYPDPEIAKYAEGYDMEDAENGTVSVVWLNK